MWKWVFTALQNALGYHLGCCKLLLSLACATSAEQIQCNPESWEKAVWRGTRGRGSSNIETRKLSRKGIRYLAALERNTFRHCTVHLIRGQDLDSRWGSSCYRITKALSTTNYLSIDKLSMERCIYNSTQPSVVFHKRKQKGCSDSALNVGQLHRQLWHPLKWCWGRWEFFISLFCFLPVLLVQQATDSCNKHREKPREAWTATCLINLDPSSPYKPRAWISMSLMNYQRAHSSTKQQQVVLILYPSHRLISFALPMAHRSFLPGMQHTPTSTTQSREELVTLCRVIIFHRFLQVSWIHALILLSLTLVFIEGVSCLFQWQ